MLIVVWLVVYAAKMKIMEFKIIKGNMSYIDDCADALIDSELGRQYFYTREKAKDSIVEGFEKEEILVAIGEDEKLIGFIWYILKGAFHGYPYLHIIAIKEEFRFLGVGTKLIEHVQNLLSENHSKCFLVVADFNTTARKLYEKMGYLEVGMIPDLYKKGVTEFLMMKLLQQEN